MKEISAVMKETPGGLLSLVSLRSRWGGVGCVGVNDERQQVQMSFWEQDPGGLCCLGVWSGRG